MKDKVEDFLSFLEYEKKYSENTIDSYRRDLEEFCSYIENHKIDYTCMKYSDVSQYLIYLGSTNLSSTSISRHMSSIRSFYEYMMKNGNVENSPFKLVRGPKKAKKLPNYLQYEEFLDLVRACDETPLGVRNRLILELLFATGIRVSEAISIKLKDINFKNREIKITGKGNKARIVYFNKICQEIMSKYVLEARQSILKGKKSDYLLVNHLGNPLTRVGLADILNRLIQKSALKHKISPHTLRHTFATLMLNEGMDIREVEELLGHARLSTTSIYTHVSNEELRKVYLASHPRAHKH